MNKQIIAYMAGIVDGEGCMYIQKQSSNHQLTPQLSIMSTNRNLIEWIHYNFSGTVYYDQYPKSVQKMNGKPTHRWVTTSATSLKIIHLIYPYLIIKKKQADIMFEFEPTIGRVKGENGKFMNLSDEQKSIRESCYWKIRELNKKGYRPES